MTRADFPAVAASLNGLSAVLIAAGWGLVRRERKLAHIVCMVAAVATSAAFLVCCRVNPGASGEGRAAWRAGHFWLSVVTVLLAVAATAPALGQRWKAHRALGGWTLPCWLGVSVWGIVVYLV